MIKELTKAQFRKMYRKYRTAGDGWSNDYWNSFYENQEGKRYFFEEPQTAEHTRMFISEGSGEARIFFLTEQQEENFFDHPGTE